MSLGLALLGSLSVFGSKEFVKVQVTEDFFVGGTEKTAYEIVKGHVLSYGVFPSPYTLTAKGVVLPETSEPPQFYLDQMQERFLHRNLKQAVLEVQDLLNAGKPAEAHELLTGQVVALSCTIQSHRIVDFAFEGGRIILDEFHKQANPNKSNLIFGWPTLDAMTGGLTGGDVISFVGRPGMGKTYMMLYAALSAWKNGYVPMFVSLEMKPLAIMQRLGAMASAVPINDLKDGFMTDTQQEKVVKVMAKAKKDGRPFWVVDGGVSATPEDILMLARQLKPDALFIDAAYLLRSTNKYLGKYERVADNIEFIKSQIAEALSIPVIVSYQLNREAEKKKKKKGEPGLEDIAYSDAIGQISSVVLGLFEDDNVETLLQRKVTILKGRNGEVGGFSIKWQFAQGVGPDSAMDFGEVQDDMEVLSYI